MSPRAFNRIMLDMSVGTNRKVRRLTVPERWTFVAGVLPLAAQSPIRGALLIATSIPVTPQDVAEQAGVSVAVAKKTLGHMRMLGMLDRDEEFGFEWVHDFNDWQREPRQDATNVIRQRRWRKKQKQATHNPVTDTVTRNVSNGGEVEKEENNPQTPKGANDFDDAKDRLRREEFEAWLTDHATVTGQTPPRAGTKALAAVAAAFSGRRSEGYSVNDLKLASRGAQADDYRRDHGYTSAESVLRPKKVHDLIERGRKANPPNGASHTKDPAAAFEAWEAQQAERRAELDRRITAGELG